MILYAIKRKIPGSFCYLKDIKPNEKYSKSACAPTMGDRHAHSEFKTMWTDEPVLFERLTAVNYLKTALEEFRWGDETPKEITLIPYIKYDEKSEPITLNDAQKMYGAEAIAMNQSFSKHDGRSFLKGSMADSFKALSEELRQTELVNSAYNLEVKDG